MSCRHMVWPGNSWCDNECCYSVVNIDILEASHPCTANVRGCGWQGYPVSGTEASGLNSVVRQVSSACLMWMHGLDKLHMHMFFIKRDANQHKDHWEANKLVIYVYIYILYIYIYIYIYMYMYIYIYRTAQNFGGRKLWRIQ